MTLFAFDVTSVLSASCTTAALLPLLIVCLPFSSPATKYYQSSSGAAEWCKWLSESFILSRRINTSFQAVRYSQLKAWH